MNLHIICRPNQIGKKFRLCPQTKKAGVGLLFRAFSSAATSGFLPFAGFAEVGDRNRKAESGLFLRRKRAYVPGDSPEEKEFCRRKSSFVYRHGHEQIRSFRMILNDFRRREICDVGFRFRKNRVAGCRESFGVDGRLDRFGFERDCMRSKVDDGHGDLLSPRQRIKSPDCEDEFSVIQDVVISIHFYYVSDSFPHMPKEKIGVRTLSGLLSNKLVFIWERRAEPCLTGRQAL